MKKTISIVTMMVLALSFGTAFAGNDDIPYMTNENETAIVLCAKDFGSAELRVAEVASDDIPAFYQKFMLRHETVIGGRGDQGAAAGGVCPEELTKGGDRGWGSFEKAITPHRESDLLPVM